MVTRDSTDTQTLLTLLSQEQVCNWIGVFVLLSTGLENGEGFVGFECCAPSRIKWHTHVSTISSTIDFEPDTRFVYQFSTSSVPSPQYHRNQDHLVRVKILVLVRGMHCLFL